MTEEEPLGRLLSPRTSWLTFPVSVDLEKLERDCLRYARYNSHVRNRDREWRARERGAVLKDHVMGAAA